MILPWPKSSCWCGMIEHDIWESLAGNLQYQLSANWIVTGELIIGSQVVRGGLMLGMTGFVARGK